jgi:hypothetical protein
MPQHAHARARERSHQRCTAGRQPVAASGRFGRRGTQAVATPRRAGRQGVYNRASATGAANRAAGPA